ncbi:Imm30 family immunity protein [Paenibacillus polymyxa]|uniref:Imm30 family immunity protein n=1 Tax=Paenibacillus TaxID=44249 RepID=UPI002025671C|nr:Imm30 family immunity protein [Paenibacillus polymyxa]URJ38332.1 Imm30 family immunity protein [Paenibacillus polymyxa]
MNEKINLLYKMRFMENEGDSIEVFENILNEMSLEGTNDIILDLCTIFEDEVAEPSANDYLIETIFYIAKRNDLEEGLYKLALGTSKMLPHAEFWAERIHRTLLNSKDLVISYGKSFDKLESTTKQTIKEILMVIKDDDPDLYLDKANSVLEKLS